MKLLLLAILFLPVALWPQEPMNSGEQKQRDTIKYGTDAEVTALVQVLKQDKISYLDDELAGLAEKTQSLTVLGALFSFFGERERTGLGGTALTILETRNDRNPALVNAAIDYLGRTRDGAALEPLRAVLDGGEERWTAASVRAYGRIAGGPDSGSDPAAYLIEYYETKNPADQLKNDLVAALGDSGSHTAPAFLRTSIQHDEERATLRLAALDALAKIAPGDASCDESTANLAAIQIALTASDANVRAGAVAALGSVPPSEKTAALLFDAFRDSFYKTRIAAAQSAAKQKLLSAIPYLRYRAESDEVLSVKEESIKALGAIGSGGALEALEELFEKPATPDSLKALAAEKLAAADPGNYAEKIVGRVLELRGKKSQIALYNRLLKALSTTEAPPVEKLAATLLSGGSVPGVTGDNVVIEKSYALDMAAANKSLSLSDAVRTLTEDKNAGLQRKALETMKALDK
jgi:HEAT repeat protein